MQEVRTLVYHNPRKVLITQHRFSTHRRPALWLLWAHFRGVSANGTRYYRDAAQIEHLRDCPQTLVRADKVEQAIVERLLGKLESAVSVPDLEAAQIRLHEAELRCERARTLYLAGEMERISYEAEKSRLENSKKSLTFFTTGDSLAFSGFSVQQLQHWAQIYQSNKKD